MIGGGVIGSAPSSEASNLWLGGVAVLSNQWGGEALKINIVSVKVSRRAGICEQCIQKHLPPSAAGPMGRCWPDVADVAPNGTPRLKNMP